jgi:hypothetical protein
MAPLWQVRPIHRTAEVRARSRRSASACSATSAGGAGDRFRVHSLQSLCGPSACAWPSRSFDNYPLVSLFQLGAHARAGREAVAEVLLPQKIWANTGTRAIAFSVRL